MSLSNGWREHGTWTADNQYIVTEELEHSGPRLVPQSDDQALILDYCDRQGWGTLMRRVPYARGASPLAAVETQSAITHIDFYLGEDFHYGFGPFDFETHEIAERIRRLSRNTYQLEMFA